jgi:lipopolysaccharide transport system permease protein
MIAKFSVMPQVMVRSLYSNRNLIQVLVVREVVGRYKGSVLGILWSFFNPLFMLVVYTFVFSVIFNARWNTGTGSKTEFALILFAGILVFNLFAECITRAPTLILSNSMYVKKVVFPLEILPWVNFGSALFHAAISLGVWVLFYLVIFGMPPVTIFLFPLLLAPLLLIILGASWFLAALGVYLRDVSQIVSLLTTALMFITPIFYPISAIPERYRFYLHLNPLAFIIDQTRNLLFFGKGLALLPFTILTLFSLVMAWLGFAWFQKTRKGFADVL